MEQNVLIPLLLTLFAGLSTGIGSAIAFFAKQTNKGFLAFSLGFSSGVMVYVSFVELLGEANKSLSSLYGDTKGQTIAAGCFFLGMLIIGIIDRLVPSYENPHEARSIEDMNSSHKNSKIMRVGIMSALTIAIHNFPEGVATFASACQDTTLGIAIAIAIAIHNIPEGVAVSVPIFYATGSRKKAFIYSFLSGLSEPIGAILAYFILMPFLSLTLLNCIFAFVAGIMVFISLDELLPAAERYGKHHHAIWGVVLGMVIMAISLITFT